MIEVLIEDDCIPFVWIDISNPSREDFKDLAPRYNLNEASIKDCLEIGHLPKIEEFDTYHFLIIRSVANSFDENSDSMTDITDRVSIFFNEKFVITVHRNEVEYLNNIKKADRKGKKFASTKALMNFITSESLKTFENLAMNGLSERLDDYEGIVFLHSKRKLFLKRLYYLKRQIDVIRNILAICKDIVDYFHMPEYKNIYTQDLRDLYLRNSTLYRNLSENTSQLLSVYFNIESNHTNEIMRTLTIISVFFMPLTFIAGIYGMNFKNMPELEWYYGYPLSLGMMAFVAAVIYIWFKRKRWM
ncbi:magnesium transporter CorA family protein [Sphingobacterium spiritivorum]|uniref:Magnesium and cobalt transport protein CorA n=1 Tax=Sphingobacterium spiritivorum ATCC 33861 TaxID=525373 RepID=D7VTW5_SPHSI|nr:CorA family divalent cation transporter [Sphingobacterium spiritivorum]EFK55744.1 putative magnesium and cobalt transport protein CorA [Sphingobacterium spiritivorum ATCC 33861]QQT34128.1 magnesium transporter CorA [Sphingobacterium spiritivorum]WQD34962.1 CorA family divalent cation transporter [Sphingobacterium spiritivorum]SUI98709.1 Magnesium transport protein CorA [Sphingobacterium spiritivorum]